MHGKTYNEQAAREKLELVLGDIAVNKYANSNYNTDEYLDSVLQENGMALSDDNVNVDGWQFIIDKNTLEIVSSLGKGEAPYNIASNEALIGQISSINNSGKYEITVMGKTNEGAQTTESYNINMTVYNGNLVLDGKNGLENATFSDGIYELGDKTQDVAKLDEEGKVTDAQNMVILKVNGNLTINEEIALTACKSDDGYGGPKGMMIFCTGTITNNGTISMTQRGARAEGQNVYLWQNKKYEDETKEYEYVPKDGANGGAGVLVSKNVRLPGIKGDDGSFRATGGRWLGCFV